MEISISTLQLAIKSIDRHIVDLEKKMQQEDLNDDELDEYGNYVMDLTNALNELGPHYEKLRESRSNMPSFAALTEQSSKSWVDPSN